ncbi:MAG: ATP-binding cassette domain-containing protein [Chloroflexota bacterium]|nr:ATP-binding cassette domain-containing protein [Chloroflexota bacterium]MDE2885927.1 ATP-binding cassette domain-containing protein [Chloroflexota bacterium]
MTSAPATLPTVLAEGLSKRFGSTVAVRNVSLSVSPAEIVGLVGPNGSGKTTTIRMLLDILRPDEGSVALFGAPVSAEAQSRIGYLPEERGLYRSLRVVPNMLYLAELKGMRREHALRRADELFARLGLEPHKGKKISELSRGLGQLVQFATTILHGPDFVVLDEPFSGLDPVNVRVMKDAVSQLRTEGAAIMFSTHQMTDVEELCDRVIMIDRGTVVLDGPLLDIKRRFAGNDLFVATDQDPQGAAGVLESRRDGAGYALRLADGSAPEDVLRSLLERGARIDRFELATPSLEEIFLRLVDRDRMEEARDAE